MDLNNIKTTFNSNCIGSSFSTDQNYFVSTVESPPNSNRFETLIKVFGQGRNPILVVVSNNSKDAVINHITMVRLCTSTTQDYWKDVVLKAFIPNSLIEEFDALELPYDPKNLNCDYCKILLMGSGLINDKNEKTSSKKTKNKKLFLTATLLLIMLILFFVSNWILYKPHSASASELNNINLSLSKLRNSSFISGSIYNGTNEIIEKVSIEVISNNNDKYFGDIPIKKKYEINTYISPKSARSFSTHVFLPSDEFVVDAKLQEATLKKSGSILGI